MHFFRDAIERYLARMLGKHVTTVHLDCQILIYVLGRQSVDASSEEAIRQRVVEHPRVTPALDHFLKGRTDHYNMFRYKMFGIITQASPQLVCLKVAAKAFEENRDKYVAGILLDDMSPGMIVVFVCDPSLGLQLHGEKGYCVFHGG